MVDEHVAVSETWLPYKISSLLQDGFPLLVCEGSPSTPHTVYTHAAFSAFLVFHHSFLCPFVAYKVLFFSATSLHGLYFLITAHVQNVAWTHCNLRRSLITITPNHIWKHCNLRCSLIVTWTITRTI